MPSFSNSFQIRFPHTWPSTCDFSSLFLCVKSIVLFGEAAVNLGLKKKKLKT